MAPTLTAGFAHLPGAFRSLTADVLLSPAPDGGTGRRPLLLTGSACQLIAWALGPARLDLAFPYLRDALHSYETQHQRTVALAVAGVALAALLALTLLLALLVRELDLQLGAGERLRQDVAAAGALRPGARRRRADGGPGGWSLEAC
jgi:hypothetical protein